MSYAPNSDYALEVAKGKVPGTAYVNKFGRNSAIASAGTEEIWDGSAAYVFPATALMTSISQTTDQTALRGGTIEVQGLADDWSLVTQNATLDAANTTTVVTLTTALRRCFRMRVLEDVVSDSPIRVHNAGETQDYAIIDTGNNQTLMAIYTVPAAKTAYVTSYYAHHNPKSGNNFTANPIKLWASDRGNAYAKQLKHVVGLPENGGFQHSFEPYVKFVAKTDLYITSSPTGAAADVSAGFDLYLVDD